MPNKAEERLRGQKRKKSSKGWKECAGERWGDGRGGAERVLVYVLLHHSLEPNLH